MNKNLKYLILLLLVFRVLAADATLYSQSKSADYCQYSFVVLSRGSILKKFRFYKFGQFVSRGKTRISIGLNFLKTENVFTFLIGELLKMQNWLYQKLISFMNQFIFLNEIITSRYFGISLYSA